MSSVQPVSSEGRAMLDERKRRFVEAYMANGGNATAAARSAGYQGDDKTLSTTGYRLLRNAKVRKAIDARAAAADDVASREERQRFWSDLMRDAQQDLRFRLKASELLGKASGDFLDRHEITGENGRPLLDATDASDSELIGVITAELKADSELSNKLLQVISEHEGRQKNERESTGN